MSGSRYPWQCCNCRGELCSCLPSRTISLLPCYKCTTDPSCLVCQQRDSLNSDPERRHDSTTSCYTGHGNTDSSEIVQDGRLENGGFESHWAVTDQDAYVSDPREYFHGHSAVRISAHLRSTGHPSWQMGNWLADGMEMACAAASAVVLSHYDHQREHDSWSCHSDSQYSSSSARCSMLSIIPPAAGIIGAIGVYGIATGFHYYRHINEQHKDRLLVGGGAVGMIWGFAMGLEPQSIVFRILPAVIALALFASTLISNASGREDNGFSSSPKDGGICTDCSSV